MGFGIDVDEVLGSEAASAIPDVFHVGPLADQVLVGLAEAEVTAVESDGDHGVGGHGIDYVVGADVASVDARSDDVDHLIAVGLGLGPLHTRHDRVLSPDVRVSTDLDGDVVNAISRDRDNALGDSVLGRQTDLADAVDGDYGGVERISSDDLAVTEFDLHTPGRRSAAARVDHAGHTRERASPAVSHHRRAALAAHVHAVALFADVQHPVAAGRGGSAGRGVVGAASVAAERSTVTSPEDRGAACATHVHAVALIAAVLHAVPADGGGDAGGAVDGATDGAAEAARPTCALDGAAGG